MSWQPGKPTAGIHRTEAKLEARVAELEQQLEELFKVITIKDGGAMATIEASAGLTIRCGGSLTVSAGGITDIKGAMVRLNGGGKPVARMNDSVVNNMVIATGATVLA